MPLTIDGETMDLEQKCLDQNVVIVKKQDTLTQNVGKNTQTTIDTGTNREPSIY